MRNPIRSAINHFLRTTPLTLLLFGLVVALLDFMGLYAAAAKEGVLEISGGVGLLQDYGLISTVFGDAVLLYLVRWYYDTIYSVRVSKAVRNPGELDQPLSVLTSMVRIEGRYRLLLYRLALIGAAFWLSNTGVHVFGNPEKHWGHKVFDSLDHPTSFVASRIHNVYTWVLIGPFVLYVLVVVSRQLRVVMGSDHAGTFRYDLLNPDGRGGFAFVEKSHLIFNLMIAVFYVQLVMHIQTFERMNIEHYVGIALATLLLVFGNRLFLGDVRATVDSLRVEALNATKEKVYGNDALSFEILKYCYQQKVDLYSVLNVVTKTAAVAISIGGKVLPLIRKAFTQV